MPIILSTLMLSSDLQSYLEFVHHYNIVGMVDVDWLVTQPRKTLYALFRSWHRPSFNNEQRIVLFSRAPMDEKILVHIQKCASLIDISNFFILLCAPSFDQDLLNQVRAEHSSDDCVFSILQVDFDDEPDRGQKNSLITLPETFCFSPWAHLEISSQGQFKPCCVYNESIKDTTGRPYNIQTDSVEQVYFSDYLSNLRQQFLRGQKPSGCSNCWYKEKNNGSSNRHWTARLLGLNAQTLLVESESIDNLISLDIKMGNLCNFKCRICSPVSSSKIAEEQLRHFDAKIDLKEINKNGRWTENPEIWNLLTQVGSQLVNIDFYGGEPFLIKQHQLFLDYMIDRGFSHQIRLHYNTNGSVFSKDLMSKWKHFREVDIAFSIDNVGHRFELERSGGIWQEVESNIDMFFQSKLPHMILSVFATVSVLNVYYIEELIDWVETKNFNALTFNLLEYPAMLSISNMNQDLSKLVIGKLLQMDQRKISQYNIQQFINRIDQTKTAPVMIDQLKTYMLKLDTVRNQDFRHTHAEIADIIFRGN